ncbi:MAG: site-specific integrase [Bacteroidaceae bacterium]|nr:site-specific integrase [Bacteroidaceae bacterium]MBQ8204532.1 site-specific integrase [Alistipes sp.]MBQ8240655.1 site-specific integrase [Bacteroides sp.]MBR3757730.1 site-specific integrase [Bacteroidaceae bacterium]
MRSTFRILFYLKRNAPKSNGLVPVMCRITVNGKISQFSCKLDVDEKHWDVKTGRMTGRSVVALEANRMLDKIRVGINKAYQDICDKDNYVTAEKVRNAFLGMGMNHETLLAVFRQHNEDYAKQVGKIKSQRSYWKYCTVYNHLSEFIRQRYKVSDIALKELAPAFITDFELFLRTEKNHCTNTIWSYMMPFKRIIYMSINNGWLQRDPFYAYSITKEETKRGFLSKEEIKMLIEGSFKKKSYELIRDLFIFCCFTGLSWTDMANLTKENLQTSFDGHLWIKTNRQKTGTETNLRLLEVPLRIIKKYEGCSEDGKLLPVPCYPNCKNGIKVIAKKCGIEKNVTWHMSRHSFATTVCLSNDMPIETLSKMLGHRSIRTTQIYAKITAEKVSNDMEKLSQALAPMENFICQAI